MVNYKSKYLEMKLKYINTKGGAQPSGVLPSHLAKWAGKIKIYNKPGRPAKRVKVERVRSDKKHVYITDEDGSNRQEVLITYLTEPGGHIETPPTPRRPSGSGSGFMGPRNRPSVGSTRVITKPSSGSTQIISGLVRPATPATGPGGAGVGNSSSSAFWGPVNRPGNRPPVTTSRRTGTGPGGVSRFINASNRPRQPSAIGHVDRHGQVPPRASIQDGNWRPPVGLRVQDRNPNDPNWPTQSCRRSALSRARRL